METTPDSGISAVEDNADDAEPGRLTPKRIVVGIDRSEHSWRALEWAVAEAERSQAALEIHTSFPPGYEFITREEVMLSMNSLLDEAVGRVQSIAPKVQTTGFKHEEMAVDALLEASKHADLLVVGSRGRGQFAELLLGSVSIHCVFHARCSVVIVRDL